MGWGGGQTPPLHIFKLRGGLDLRFLIVSCCNWSNYHYTITSKPVLAFFFYFLWQGGRAKMTQKGKWLKFVNIKLSTNIFIFWNLMLLCMRDRVFNWRPAFWHSAVTCFSKFSLLSILMPNNVTVFSESVLRLSIKNS